MGLTRSMLRGLICTLVIASQLTACGLAAYARPQARTVPGESLSSHDLIKYRELAIEDFLASQPPPFAAAHQHHFWAYSCLQLRPRDSAPLTTVQFTEGDVSRYSATPDDLRYLAYFDRDCSWWNHAVTTPTPYTLQHEQIHFLITELQARRLNRRVAEITLGATSLGDTPQAAIAAANQKLWQVMKAAVEEMGVQHLAFDRDASNGAHPEQQQAWWDRLSVELAQSDRDLAIKP